MSTASTKSPNRKPNRRSAGPPPKTTPPKVARLPQTRDISDRAWLFCSLFIMAVGAILRVYNLSLVPFHHDEGVNGNFLVGLVRQGSYTYDPANYHGPTLYYFSAVIPWILRLFGESAQNKYGLNTVTVRLVPALFGLATIWLVLLLRRRIGTVGTLCAALLLAVSPGAVYLSRYFIHETLFVFFTLAVVVAGLKYYEAGNAVYLLLAATSLALLFATKETAIVSAAVLAIALATTCLYLWLWNWFFRGNQKDRKQRRLEKGPETPPEISAVQRLGGPTKLALLAVLAIVVFVGVNVFFYSSPRSPFTSSPSFFTNYPKGVHDAIKTFQFWTRTGKEAHVHPISTYVWWLLQQELPLIFFGAVGAALVVWRPRNAFALFSALWAFGLLAAYSLINYKTPWLVLNFVVPLALIGGYALQVIYDWGLGEIRLIIAVMLLAVAISGYKTVDLNFFNYDNDAESYVYVYAHSRREMLALIDEIEKVAQRTKQGTKTGITIVSPDYWPLPWYFRDYTGVGYHGRMTTSTEPVIIASESQGAEVQATFGDNYQQIQSGFNPAGSYALRPGVNLLLYVRRDVLGP